MLIIWFRMCVMEPVTTTLVFLLCPKKRHRLLNEWCLMSTVWCLSDEALENAVQQIKRRYRRP